VIIIIHEIEPKLQTEGTRMWRSYNFRSTSAQTSTLLTPLDRLLVTKLAEKKHIIDFLDSLVSVILACQVTTHYQQRGAPICNSKQDQDGLEDEASEQEKVTWGARLNYEYIYKLLKGTQPTLIASVKKYHQAAHCNLRSSEKGKLGENGQGVKFPSLTQATDAKVFSELSKVIRHTFASAAVVRDLKGVKAHPAFSEVFRMHRTSLTALVVAYHRLGLRQSLPPVKLLSYYRKSSVVYSDALRHAFIRLQDEYRGAPAVTRGFTIDDLGEYSTPLLSSHTSISQNWWNTLINKWTTKMFTELMQQDLQEAEEVSLYTLITVSLFLQR
jgi:hypothetical protein